MKIPLPFPYARHRTDAGFTLIELLVVLAIVAVLATASIPVFRGVNSALNLSTAGQLIASEITMARQTALTYGETVEIRFYYYWDAISGASQFQAIQTFSTTDGNNFKQVDRISYLPASIMIDETPGTPSTALSYPFGESNSTVNVNYTPSTSTGALSIPGDVGMNYTYKSLRFKPDGTIDFVIPASGAPSGWTPASWFITLYEKKYSGTTLANAGKIKNFITVNVDSANGRVRVLQP